MHKKPQPHNIETIIWNYRSIRVGCQKLEPSIDQTSYPYRKKISRIFGTSQNNTHNVFILKAIVKFSSCSSIYCVFIYNYMFFLFFHKHVSAPWSCSYMLGTLMNQGLAYGYGILKFSLFLFLRWAELWFGKQFRGEILLKIRNFRLIRNTTHFYVEIEKNNRIFRLLLTSYFRLAICLYHA